MTLEEQYAARWKKDARAEGHVKRLPPSPIVSISHLKKPEAYDAILKSVQKGNSCIEFIANDTGFSRQFVQDRLRRLKEGGKIEKVGNQWRIKE